MDIAQVPPAAVHAQLARVLASDTFRGAERSKTLLTFIVEEALQGRASRLKDYTLGAEALGRGDGFDPRADPIARVEASRLRSRLKVYYATEGAADAVRISLPKGGYVPQFEARTIAPTTPPMQPVPAQGDAIDPSRRANPMGRRPRLLAAIAAGLGVLFVTSAGLFIRGLWGARGAAEVRAAIPTPPTTDPVSLAISPDGRVVVFVATSDGRSQLWIRPLDSDAYRPLAGTENASLPFWSPNGRSVGFFADGKVKRLDLDNGLVRVLSAAPVPAGASWNREGVILHPLVPDTAIFRTSADGAALQPVTALGPGHTGHRGPVFLPDGRRFLFYAAGTSAVRGIHVGELGHTRVRRLLDADAPAVFAAPEHLLYLKRATLFAHRLDPRTVTLIGEPIALAAGVTFEGAAGVSAIAASANRTIVYRAGQSGDNDDLC